MFTGIVRWVSRIENLSPENGGLKVVIRRPRGLKIKTGDSVAVNGICSTVRVARKKKFEVLYMPETIRRTTANHFQKGAPVNLETSLTLSSRLDGHIVQGHVDGTGKILEIQNEKKFRMLKISLPPDLRRLVVPKGSISVDGVSLTVVGTGPDWFTVSLIDYTLAHTTLDSLKRGDRANIETDIIGKYVASVLKTPLN